MKKTATYIITVKWTETKNKMMSSQIARDKLFIPIQEMWIMGYVDEVNIKDLKEVSLLSRENEKGKREGYHKIGFPAKK